MTQVQRQICSLVLATACAGLSACVTKIEAPPPVQVMVPPRVDLRAYDAVGIVELASNAKGNLHQFATQKLIETIVSAQPGSRILELGDEAHVLASIRRDELSFGAVQAIGEKYGVDAVLIGRLDVTNVKPRFQLSNLLTSMSAEADVEAALSARLLETESGATVWTNSAQTGETVAHVSVIPHGPSEFSASDPEEAYGRLVQVLVRRVSDDFQPRYEYR
jgi:hypothetical protein